jgi:hypothetical protein
MIVVERFAQLLKDDIDYVKNESLDFFLIRFRNIELCLHSIAILVGKTREVTFLRG